MEMAGFKMCGIALMTRAGNTQQITPRP